MTYNRRIQLHVKRANNKHAPHQYSNLLLNTISKLNVSIQVDKSTGAILHLTYLHTLHNHVITQYIIELKNTTARIPDLLSNPSNTTLTQTSFLLSPLVTFLIALTLIPLIRSKQQTQKNTP